MIQDYSIYMIKNSNNGYVYIGKTCDVEQRKKCHFDCLRKNIHSNKLLQFDWSFYHGIGFEFSILEQTDKNNVNALEKKWIKSIAVDVCYNIQHNEACKPWIKQQRQKQAKEAKELYKMIRSLVCND